LYLQPSATRDEIRDSFDFLVVVTIANRFKDAYASELEESF
jgi:hypothetical protein